MMLVRPLMTSLKITIRDDCAVSACSSPLPTVYKCPHPLLVGREGEESAFGQTPTTLSHAHPQLQASEIKQTFLSTNLAYLLAFEQRSARPTHSFQ